MASRHDVDTTTRLDPDAELPETREVERTDTDVAAADPEVLPLVREPYLMTAAVVEAANIAIALGRPLLVQGDPGCGKTRLAHAVAYALGLPLERAHVKSTTRAQDLLWTFDAVSRLYDAQLGDKAPIGTDGRPRPDDPGNYVRLEAFGRAIARAEHGRRSVVLIDEIDKADLDFPNDLLHELDRLEITVTETGRRFAVPAGRPELRPIVVVTNNEEKPLPQAFLRRCVYHELRFPDDDVFLARVLAAHDVVDRELVDRAVRTLLEIRSLPDLTRRPGLSELIDWVRYLHAFGGPPEAEAGPAALGALVKSPHDQDRVRRGLATR